MMEQDPMRLNPVMLLSIVNMKLRDEFKHLNEYCEDANLSPEEIKEKLKTTGYEYNEEKNQFIRKL
ncbi:DUF4250 domain-containing protein [Haloplasma contractile]|uniref:DUF4250 domain-containing protein n=1 Tax=Haloplasma contractile SSD-17B TaxID=1033810 RepID=F7PU44_9MOLU|nr:DUF4250 domain-containing protein [Haloplasma contractile]ERJ11778.1 hypothetical protein HLPCO_002261 [Haloplasma contractile SSD-17B]